MRALFSFIAVFVFMSGCKQHSEKNMVPKEAKIRPAKGFAQHSWQMDSIYKRLHLKDTLNYFTHSSCMKTIIVH